MAGTKEHEANSLFSGALNTAFYPCGGHPYFNTQGSQLSVCYYYRRRKNKTTKYPKAKGSVSVLQVADLRHLEKGGNESCQCQFWANSCLSNSSIYGLSGSSTPISPSMFQYRLGSLAPSTQGSDHPRFTLGSDPHRVLIRL
jgi:hypothetical protein